MAQNNYGQWSKKKSLGEGGQGITYLVENPKMPNETYVLKRLKNSKRIGRFKREIDVLKKIDHPYILKIIDSDLDTLKPYFVTTFCEEGSLKYSKLEKFSLNDKIEFFEKICSGISHAHANKIIHRDIKPENIFLDKELNPIIGDFGICFVEDGERHTHTDEAVGAFRFMAPEVEDGKEEKVNCSSDVYSLGKLFYWILSEKTFSREQHRKELYNLFNIYQSPEFALINEFLDKMIIADVKKRLSDGKNVLEELSILKRRIILNCHVIDPKIPQHCNYCGIGTYRRKVDTLSESNAIKLNKFGFRSESNERWLILVCDHCYNVQFFRPDLNEGAMFDQKWVLHPE